MHHHDDYARQRRDDRTWRRGDDRPGGLRERRTASRPAFPADGEGISGAGIPGTEDFDPRRARRARWQREHNYRYGEADPRYSDDDRDRIVPREETSRLIASDKVEGTAVYDRDGERIGAVENFMVTKRSGRVEYVVLSFGGFMGLGDRHYPLDWEQLEYDERLDGYVIDLRKAEVQRTLRDH